MRSWVIYCVLVFGISACGTHRFEAVSIDSESGLSDSTGLSDSSTTSDSNFGTDSETGTDTNVPINLSCSSASSSFHNIDEKSSQVLIVGSGTACTSAQLQAAFDQCLPSEFCEIKFDCGGTHSEISLESPLVISEGSRVYINAINPILLAGVAEAHTRLLEIGPGAKVYIQGVTFSQGVSVDRGGAIFYQEGKGAGELHLKDCGFFSNTAVQNGGAIYVHGVSQFRVSNCTFSGNSAKVGGALWVLGNDMALSRVTVSDNESETEGGGIYFDGGDDMVAERLIICDSAFTANESEHHGSAIKQYLYGEIAAVIIRTLFDANKTLSDSASYGALYHHHAPLLIEQSTFMNNISQSSCGGVYLDNAVDVQMNNCTFYNNVAENGLGGAVFVPSNSGAEFTHCTFVGNVAFTGPAINFPGENAGEVYNSIFIDNFSRQIDGYSADCNYQSVGKNVIQWNSAGEEPSISCAIEMRFADPLLGDIGDNGGLVPTIPISNASSPAVGFGEDNCTEYDARNEYRERPCDVGAFELQ